MTNNKNDSIIYIVKQRRRCYGYYENDNRSRFIFKDSNGVSKYWWILHDSKDCVSFIDTKGYRNFSPKNFATNLLTYKFALRPVIKINKL